jgi:hypothetical protein
MDWLPERLKTKIAVSPETGCWIWTGALDRRGYGRVNIHGRVRFTHRVTFVLAGRDLSDELEIDHLCRVPACCNPDHLEAVTRVVNHHRSTVAVATRARYANHLWCPKGHPLFGDNLYAHTTRSGYVNKQCRECRRASKRRVNARLKAERAAARSS